tara:strand:+ start:588 stop:812 length:225 start_codon:yes stop_codon:yes gene_type:complete
MGVIKNMLFPKTPKPDNSIMREQQERTKEAEKKLEDERKKFLKLGKEGRSSLIMTGGQGVEEEATIMKRTLGGY